MDTLEPVGLELLPEAKQSAVPNRNNLNRHRSDVNKHLC